jgi:hypothetical protein
MTGRPSDAHMLETASYTLTVSGDPRFLDTVRALAAKTAETVGVAPAETAPLVEAIGVLMATIVEAVANPAAPDIMHVRFAVEPKALGVEVACEAPAGAPAGWTLERALASQGRLDAFRALAPDAVFSVSGTHHLCRFTCAHTGRA